METKNIILLILLTLLSAVLIFFAGRWTKRPDVVEVEVVTTDTLTVHDTVRIEKPKYITQKVVDSIYVPVRDTIHLHDTTFVVLQRTQSEYADSLYHAWVSGYDPALDSIHVFTKTQYITTTIQKPPKHWHVGISAGYGATIRDKQVFLSPYLGVGLTYSLFSF